MKHNFSFAIGIPTINRWDLLEPFLKKYIINFPLTHIYIVDNGKQDIHIISPFVHIIRNNIRQGVAASWNTLCANIYRNHNYAFILNDDIFVSKREEDISKFLTLHPSEDFYSCAHGFSSFIIPKETFREVGPFDEEFKGAYFEDNDYEMRLKLAKKSILKHIFLNPSIFHRSSSIDKDPSLNINFEANYTYYQKKWGGNVGAEKFKTPFNKQ